MQVWRLVLLGSLMGSVLFGTAGCQNGGNPTEPEALNKLTDRGLATQPSDDISPSDIVKTPYRAYKIVTVGDSITYGVCASRSSASYPGRLENYLRTSGYETSVYNRGDPGATSEDVTAEIDRYLRGMDIVLIMIGANDVATTSYCVDPYSPTECETLANIRFLLNRALQAHVVPVLGMVTPKKSSSYMALYNPRIQALNSRLAAMAAEYQIAIVDTYTAILNNGGDNLFCDKHHFTDAGYDVLANAFYQTLTTQVVYSIF